MGCMHAHTHTLPLASMHPCFCTPCMTPRHALQVTHPSGRPPLAPTTRQPAGPQPQQACMGPVGPQPSRSPTQQVPSPSGPQPIRSRPMQPLQARSPARSKRWAARCPGPLTQRWPAVPCPPPWCAAAARCPQSPEPGSRSSGCPASPRPPGMPGWGLPSADSAGRWVPSGGHAWGEPVLSWGGVTVPSCFRNLNSRVCTQSCSHARRASNPAGICGAGKQASKRLWGGPAGWTACSYSAAAVAGACMAGCRLGKQRPLAGGTLVDFNGPGAATRGVLAPERLPRLCARAAGALFAARPA